MFAPLRLPPAWRALPLFFARALRSGLVRPCLPFRSHHVEPYCWLRQQNHRNLAYIFRFLRVCFGDDVRAGCWSETTGNPDILALNGAIVIVWCVSMQTYPRAFQEHTIPVQGKRCPSDNLTRCSRPHLQNDHIVIKMVLSGFIKDLARKTHVSTTCRSSSWKQNTSILNSATRCLS